MKHRILAMIILCTIIFLTGAAYSQIVTGDLGKKIDAYFENLVQYGFGGSFVIEKDGEMILAKGYGMADLESGRKNSQNTVYEIASLSKPFTAMAIMILEQRGKLSTDDVIAKYIDNVPAEKKGITIEQLLLHTSGMTTNQGRFNEKVTRQEVIKRILHSPLTQIPGEKYEYSNGGYGILAEIIERASGISYSSFLRENIFRKAEMTQTGFYGDKNRWKPEEMATGYYDQKSKGTPDTWHPEAHYGSSSIVSNVLDLYKWISAVSSNKILNKNYSRKFLAEDKKGDNQVFHAYGFDILQTQWGGELIYQSGSEISSHHSILIWFTEKNMKIIALGNVTKVNDDRSELRYATKGICEIANMIFKNDFSKLPDWVGKK